MTACAQCCKACNRLGHYVALVERTIKRREKKAFVHVCDGKDVVRQSFCSLVACETQSSLRREDGHVLKEEKTRKTAFMSCGSSLTKRRLDVERHLIWSTAERLHVWHAKLWHSLCIMMLTIMFRKLVTLYLQYICIKLI